MVEINDTSLCYEFDPVTPTAERSKAKPFLKSNASTASPSAEGTTAGSSSSVFCISDGRSSGRTQHSKAVWAIRLVFLILLFGVAVALGMSGYFIVKNSEQALGVQQFDAMAARALDLGEDLAVRRRVVVKSMAQIAGAAFPNHTMWPNVAIPAFQTISQDLIKTSGNMEFGFYPMVQPEDEVPEQQASFEAFAYDFFYNKRNPPFPVGTADHSFGRGIWRAQDAADLNVEGAVGTKDLRVHDTSGEARSWHSPNKILFPELQNSNSDVSGRLFLMFNIHSIPSKGEPLDDVMACVSKRKAEQDPDMDCGVVTEILSWNRDSFLMQPIYPAQDLMEVNPTNSNPFLK